MRYNSNTIKPKKVNRFKQKNPGKNPDFSSINILY